jgi:transposase
MASTCKETQRPGSDWIIEYALHCTAFVAANYVADSLVPVLKAGDTVILDNLQAHKAAGVCEAIEAARARILYLPPYSPEFNPIEQIFSKLKHLLRTAAAGTIPELWAAIREAFAGFTPDERRNCLTTAGYEDDLAVAT